MILLSAFIPGMPAAQPRTKARATVLPSGKPVARVYTPKGPAGPWKARVALMAATERERGAFAEAGVPVRMTLRLVFPRPKARTWKTKPMPAEWHTGKPDLDNLEKAVLDALNGVLFHDDSQVCSVLKEKLVAEGGAEVGAWVHVETIEQAPA